MDSGSAGGGAQTSRTEDCRLAANSASPGTLFTAPSPTGVNVTEKPHLRRQKSPRRSGFIPVLLFVRASGIQGRIPLDKIARPASSASLLKLDLGGVVR